MGVKHVLQCFAEFGSEAVEAQLRQELDLSFLKGGGRASVEMGSSKV